jgi:hypothetical protein
MAAEIWRPGPATNATTEVLRQVQTLLDGLEHGQLFWFADWPVAAVPRSGAIVYTVYGRSGRDDGGARLRTFRALEQSRQRPSQRRSVLRLHLRSARAAYARRHSVSSVRAFASVTSTYRQVLQRVRWRDAGMQGALLLAPEAKPGINRGGPGCPAGRRPYQRLAKFVRSRY